MKHVEDMAQTSTNTLEDTSVASCPALGICWECRSSDHKRFDCPLYIAKKLHQQQQEMGSTDGNTGVSSRRKKKSRNNRIKAKIAKQGESSEISAGLSLTPHILQDVLESDSPSNNAIEKNSSSESG